MILIIILVLLLVLWLFSLQINKNKYDVIYSYTCHEEPLSFIDTLNNLFYFNSTDTCVIVHCNEYMYNFLPKLLKENKNKDKVHINKIYSNKKLYTFSILQAHIENFQFCIENKIKSKYFIPLASNCLFNKHISLKDMDKSIDSLNKFVYTDSDKNIGWIWWNDINKNIKINNRLYKLCIKNLLSQSHEGSIIPYNVMNKIYQFIIKNKLKQNVQKETVFEEYLLATLGTFYLGKKIPLMCKVYWDKHNFTPSYEDIKNQSEPCFKRVSREYNDPLRVIIRKDNNGYN